MKSYRKKLWLNVPGRRGFVNITPQVEAALRESGIKEGLCLVNAMHITASVFINDDNSERNHPRDRRSPAACTRRPNHPQSCRRV